MKRRKFLGLTAISAFAAAVPAAGWSAVSFTESAAVPVEPDLVHILGDRDAVRRIGNLYRRAHPMEDDADVLRSAIVRGLPRSSDAARLGAELGGKIRADFEADRTVRVDGWMLARTEARQCALFALTAA